MEAILQVAKEMVEDMAMATPLQLRTSRFANILNVVQPVENSVSFHFDIKVDFMILALQWMIKVQNLEMLGAAHLLIPLQEIISQVGKKTKTERTH